MTVTNTTDLWSTALAAFIGSLAGATAGALLVASIVALRMLRRPPNRRETDD